MMAPPPSTAVSPVISLVVRVLTFICLLISLIILATNTITTSTDYGDVKIKFNDFYAYRYLLATTVIGLAYSLLQIAFAIFLVSTGNTVANGLVLFDFYADKAASYLLATGAAASFALTHYLKNQVGTSSNKEDKFLNMANAAASLCLLGFLFSAISSIFSSYALPKRA
ncbi:hypothetical protein M9H77_11067 [Catharanthus roseus]|uniref:Uncharacterized protein n=1 Tax=Catharanthus roseus TaxID=4058 RepID=A0ACC0BDS5_CATRO|nr:hypothetical protein M9H77_11067 [Catharanthus roseus]